MKKEQYIAVATALGVVVLFFIIMGIGTNTGQPSASLSTLPEEGSRFTVPSGITMQDVTELQIQDEVVGNGTEAIPGSTVTVEYTGAFTNGTIFDSSRGRAPFTFELGAGAVIPGWDQGVAGMKVGGKRVLSIPPQLGYGSEDYGPIPGGSTLIFEVELLSVE